MRLIERGLRLLHLGQRLLGARALLLHLLRSGLRVLLRRPAACGHALAGYANAVFGGLFAGLGVVQRGLVASSAAATAASYCCLLMTSFSTSGL